MTLRPLELALAALASGALVLLTLLGVWQVGWSEVFGFITGGVCVWLMVRQNLWTWPIGLANNAIFFVLFLDSRLFADMTLQVVYFVLGLFGWWTWRYGGRRPGQKRGQAEVTRTLPLEWLGLAAAVPAATLVMRHVLTTVNGASPLWDALSTALCLAAQYLATRKRLENWLFWIAADLVYVPLYVARDLPLTAALYAVFLAMCVAGLVQWWRSLAPAPGRMVAA